MPSDFLDHVVALWDAERVDISTWPLEIFGRLRRITDLLERELAGLFAEHKLSGGEFEVLSALRRVGTPYELSPTDLSRALILTPGGMTKRLDSLEKAGLVIRRRHPEDRRALLIRLTDQGREVMDDLMPRVMDSISVLLAPVERDSAELIRLLRTVLAGLESSVDRSAVGVGEGTDVDPPARRRRATRTRAG